MVDLWASLLDLYWALLLGHPTADWMDRHWVQLLELCSELLMVG